MGQKMITLGQLSDFSATERAQLQAACDLVNKCLADPAFIAILNGCAYDNTTDDVPTIVKNITAPMTIIRMYCEDMGWWATHWSKTIAEESPDGTVTFNRAFFDDQDSPSLANTLFHEACHVAGYSHYSSTDYASVPYQAGNKLEDYARSLSS